MAPDPANAWCAVSRTACETRPLRGTFGDTLTERFVPQAEQPAQTITIRLAEVDAPEHHQPFGERSKQTLAGLCFQKPAACELSCVCATAAPPRC